jgi:hypothetical protein
VPFWKWLIVIGLIATLVGATLLFFRGAVRVGELSGDTSAAPIRVRIGFGLIAVGSALQV